MVTPKTVTTKTPAIGKKTVQFLPKPSNSSSTKADISIQKPTATVATIDVQDDIEV